jgi:hypothetical protein
MFEHNDQAFTHDQQCTKIRMVYTVQGKTWQHDTRTATKTPHVATVRGDDQRDDPVLPHPSARLPRDTSPGYPWVAQTLSQYTSWRNGCIVFVSVTIQATKFTGPINRACTST